MNNKFLIFIRKENYEPIIVLSKTDYHKNIPYLFDDIVNKAGGGWWEIKNKTLILSGNSEDFW